jgi:hypothetical protein
MIRFDNRTGFDNEKSNRQYTGYMPTITLPDQYLKEAQGVNDSVPATGAQEAQKAQGIVNGVATNPIFFPEVVKESERPKGGTKSEGNVTSVVEDILSLRPELQNRPEVVAGILGNLAIETGRTFDPDTKQVGAADPAVGLFQNDPRGMRPQYLAYLEKNKIKDSQQAQIKFFFDTIYDDQYKGIIGDTNVVNARKALSTQQQTPEYFAKLFNDVYFKPGAKESLPARTAEAKKYYDWLFDSNFVR